MGKLIKILKNHIYSPVIAELVGGPDRAFIISFILWSCEMKTDDPKPYYEEFLNEGKYWCKDSIPAWNKRLPWITPRTIRSHMTYLIKNGWLESRQFGKKNWDRTNYYRVNEENLEASLKEYAAVPTPSDEIKMTPIDEAKITPSDEAKITPSHSYNLKTNKSLNKKNPSAKSESIPAVEIEVIEPDGSLDCPTDHPLASSHEVNNLIAKEGANPAVRGVERTNGKYKDKAPKRYIPTQGEIKLGKMWKEQLRVNAPLKKTGYSERDLAYQMACILHADLVCDLNVITLGLWIQFLINKTDAHKKWPGWGANIRSVVKALQPLRDNKFIESWHKSLSFQKKYIAAEEFKIQKKKEKEMGIDMPF